MFASVLGGLHNCMEHIKRFDVQRGRHSGLIKPRDTIIPIAVVSILFFLWGLAYGLLDIMNYHVKVAMGISRGQAAGLAAGYYTAYIPGALLIGGPLVKKCGYRVAMVVGLFLLAFGDLMMSFAAGGCSLAGMVVAHFIVGLGVSTLERSANPYAVNCGPRVQAALRILVAQAWAGIGTVVAPFLANAFVFNPDTSSQAPASDPVHPGKCLMPVENKDTSCSNLSSVITFYRGVAGVIFGLSVIIALLLFRTKMVPEVEVPLPPAVECGWKKWKHPLVSWRYSRVWWGVGANFFNLGCQVTFAQFFIEHMKVNACASDAWAAICMSIAQSAFVVGRFTAAAAVSTPKVKPRLVLVAFIGGAVAFTAGGTSVTGTAAIALAVLVMFWEAPSFPMIFESATADYEEWTSTCESLMILSISGGAVQPALMGQLVESVGISAGWWLTAGCFLLVFTYPLATNVIPSYRRAVDRAVVNAPGQGSPGDEEQAKPEHGPVEMVPTNSNSSGQIEGVEPTFEPPVRPKYNGGLFSRGRGGRP
ncbi:uncharacterized protein PV06_01916 [Exophiala oligosperma]|uniref:Major facilitator superfamily (MFS) profile domain-containing protein n=2 Tax=Chaetothyriales TaxID=34395 RepID=A0A0D2DT25_9EURO|nr:uncharacterized protein PV06_01916 [Exophiala oligosperma]KAJ9646079.1 hypothetical protein H2204_000741 [Knufia peltigerae]KIW46233.1 hypothetical protein PV06_01916 [Exophiala oligosperma]